MNEEDFYLIPLWRRDQTIGSYAMVSVEDYDSLMQHRWFRGPKQKYAMYSIRPGGRKGKLHSVLMHRHILELGAYDKENMVDHINGNTLDNRRSNLRLVHRSVNCQNAKRRSDNTSGHRGISWDKARRKWRCGFQKDGTRIEVGLFDRLESAVAARDVAIQNAYKYYVRFD